MTAMENGHNGSTKIASAMSIESLDNCSTHSSAEQPSQVRTLFVSGLPIDTRPRELYLLFRGCPGYEASLLKVTQNKNGKTNTPVGFVTFASRQDADEARRNLQGVRFDPEHSQTIRLELARSNTKVTKPKQPSPPVISPSNLPTILQSNGVAAHLASAFPGALTNGSQAYSTANIAAAYAAAAQQMAAMQQAAAVNSQQEHLNLLDGAGTAFLQPQQQIHQDQQLLGLSPFANAQAAQIQQLQQFFQNPVTSNAAVVAAQQQQQVACVMAQLQQQQNAAALLVAQQQQAVVAAAANGFLPPPPPQNRNTTSINKASNNNNCNNQPCSTLFVANLGVNVNEEEIRQLFKAFPGFSRLRMHNKNGSPVAFVEYQDVRQAGDVLNALQGYSLSSTERNNGIRIEFARSKMGDVSHNNNSNVQSQNNNSAILLKQD